MTSRTDPAGRRQGRLLLWLLVAGLLMADLLTGMLEQGGPPEGVPSPAAGARGLVLLVALTLYLRSVGPELLRLQLAILVLAALGSCGLLATFFQGGSLHDLTVDVSQLFKVLYGPLLVLVIIVLMRQYRLTAEDALDAMAWAAGLAGASIAVLAITGLGQHTYQLEGAGSKGLFISQNDIGLAMGIGLVAAMYRLFSAWSLRQISLVVLSIVGMFVLGTRAALLSAVGIPLLALLTYCPEWIKNRRVGASGLLLGAFALAAFAIAGAWRYNSLQTDTFQRQRFETLTEDPFVRGLRVVAAYDYVRERPLMAAIIGEGSLRYGRGVGRRLGLRMDGVLAEVDWMDLFGAYGVLFTVMIYGFYVTALRHAGRLRVRRGPALVRTARLAIGLFLLHSIIAGHALGGTIPEGTLAPILAVIWRHGSTGRGAEVMND